MRSGPIWPGVGERKIDYPPVVFPGFSWHNMCGAALTRFRSRGEFCGRSSRRTGSGTEMLYVAMFDEVTRGSRFKCTNDPLTTEETPFVSYEGLPTDYYSGSPGLARRCCAGNCWRTRRAETLGCPSERDREFRDATN